MLISLLKRFLPFLLTLIFGIGLGSVFGGGSSSPRTTTEVAPSFAPTQTYGGCRNRRRNFNGSNPSQSENSNATPTRSEPTLIVR
jgi:hypothetical protein